MLSQLLPELFRLSSHFNVPNPLNIKLWSIFLNANSNYLSIDSNSISTSYLPLSSNSRAIPIILAVNSHSPLQSNLFNLLRNCGVVYNNNNEHFLTIRGVDISLHSRWAQRPSASKLKIGKHSHVHYAGENLFFFFRIFKQPDYRCSIEIIRWQRRFWCQAQNRRR